MEMTSIGRIQLPPAWSLHLLMLTAILQKKARIWEQIVKYWEENRRISLSFFSLLLEDEVIYPLFTVRYSKRYI